MPGNNSHIAAQREPDLRRRWLYLMPVVFVTYSLAYLGRSNFGFGAAAGMAKSLNITESRAAFLASAFFLGYFLFQIPAATYAVRRSATRLVFFALICWGIFSALTGVIRVYWLLVADRLLLGVAESLILPSMLILLTNWFTKAERSRANAILILGNPVTVTWMAAVTGYLIRGVGWQMTFILEGIPSIVWAFVWLGVARDQPVQVRWLSRESSGQLTEELAREQASLPQYTNFLATLRVPGVLLLCFQYFSWSFGVYGLVLWIPEMIRSGSSRGIGQVGVLSAAPFLLAVILMLVVSAVSDRTLNRKPFVWPFLILSGVGLFCSFATAGDHFWLSYLSLIVAGGAMYAPYGPFFAIMPEMLPRNVVGEVIALVNSCGALGGFAGTWLVGWLQALTGNARAGFLAMSVALIVAGAITLCLPSTRREPHPA
ncbi:Sugar phosphate permease [Candidatus Sulfotelmatomonas gaucii]|uniref:Sugar phosphate permease n=1 Tax=Candidatus Sulfuritelmatomonas gaucii TaxID=2043161 RepID=A0A2N9L9U1_9BACT|nr:Sugar phosphate permease [Candidatus Sulfotelmatomonas gaucii]